MKIGGIVDQKQSLLLIGVRPQHFHFRHCRSQFLYRFLHQRIITVIVDCLDGVQVNGLAGQNRKRSFIVASVFQLKTNALDPNTKAEPETAPIEQPTGNLTYYVAECMELIKRAHFN